MDLVHDHDRRHLVGHLGRVTKRRRGGRGGHGDSAGRMIQGPGPGAATGIGEARERTPLTVTVQCDNRSRRVRVQYDRTSRGVIRRSNAWSSAWPTPMVAPHRGA